MSHPSRGDGGGADPTRPHRCLTYLPLGVVPADDPLSECPTHPVGTGLRCHTYLPLGVVSADDPLSECPTNLVWTGLRYHTYLPLGVVPSDDPVS